MSIGQMKDRITVNNLIKNSNGRGGWIHTEEPIGTFWGEIGPISGSKVVQFRQADLKSNAQIIMRANERITRETVLYARGQKFEVEEVIRDNDYITLLVVGEKIGQ